MTETTEKEDLSKRKMMTDCDIVLMIPGRCDHTADADWKQNIRTSPETEFLIDAIKKNVGIEMSRDAQDAIHRYNLGTASLRFNPDMDMPRKDTFTKRNVSLMLAHHKSTGLCVLEIYITDSEDGVQMLECYGNDAVDIRPKGRDKFIPMEEFLGTELKIKVTGLKRSAVFAYGDPSEQECAHCIANELTPHDGDVQGVLLDKVRHQDRSQYSGSRTYASATTLLEVMTMGDKPEDVRDRIDYQTSEIYFVEQILLRDASATDIADKLNGLSDRIETMKAKDIKEALTKIDVAYSRSIALYKVSLFKWATVHEELRLLSEDLGVPVIEERNRNNKSILESLQRSVEAKEKERSDKLKNGFLLAITGMTLIETLYTALTNFFSRNMVYYSSVLIVLGAFLIYVVVKKHRE